MRKEKRERVGVRKERERKREREREREKESGCEKDSTCNTHYATPRYDIYVLYSYGRCMVGVPACRMAGPPDPPSDQYTPVRRMGWGDGVDDAVEDGGERIGERTGERMRRRIGERTWCVREQREREWQQAPSFYGPYHGTCTSKETLKRFKERLKRDRSDTDAEGCRGMPGVWLSRVRLRTCMISLSLSLSLSLSYSCTTPHMHELDALPKLHRQPRPCLRRRLRALHHGRP